MSSKYAVLGAPIAHSLSPAIHRAAFGVLGKPHSYERFELAAGLAEFVSAEGSDFSGFSVTMPLKHEALELSESVDDLASRTRAVNTLLKTESGWAGFNTDVLGFRKAIEDKDCSVVSIIGTGATARSALVAFAAYRPTLWGRDQSKASFLADEYGAKLCSLDDALRADLVVSTLPKGALTGLVGESHFTGTLFDVVYADWPTKTSTHFPESISGLELLLNQALFQQRIFAFGNPDTALPNEDALLAAMRSAVEMAE